MLESASDSAVFGAILIALNILLLAFVLVSRAPLRAIGRLLRLPARIVLWAPRRLLQILRVLPAGTRARQAGASAWAMLIRYFRPETLTEEALRGLDDGSADRYDFENNEDKRLRRSGVLFKWIHVPPGYLSDVALLTEEIGRIYLQKAKEFFSVQVDITADKNALYEDVEGAFIVRLFRERDRNGLYLLHKMRRIINDNVRKLSFIFSVIVALVFLVGLFLPDLLSLIGTYTDIDHPNRPVIGVLLCLGGAFLMWLLFYTEYTHNQRNNGREMRSFLSRYMSRLSDRYRAALAKARGVTVGDETDSAILSSEAKKWHKILLWMSFRAFFLECFIRNIQFQIRRNSDYYVVFIPMAFAIALLVILSTAGAVGWIDLAGHFSALGPWFSVSFAALLAIYLFFLDRSMSWMDELDQLDWLGFDNFNVDEAMDEVVGKYAEDVGYWKRRPHR